MPIVHNSYVDGNAQSLSFKDGPQDVVVGVLEAGDYDFGPATRPGEMHVLTGELIVDKDGRKTRYYPETPNLVFEVGDPVAFTATPGTSYISWGGLA